MCRDARFGSLSPVTRRRRQRGAAYARQFVGHRILGHVPRPGENAHAVRDSDQSMTALHGIRVLDLSRVLAGPSCGQLFADLGAEVIKVEDRGGDENRKWLPVVDGRGANFMSVNRGKRGMTLNLKSPSGQRILEALLHRSDVRRSASAWAGRAPPPALFRRPRVGWPHRSPHRARQPQVVELDGEASISPSRSRNSRLSQTFTARRLRHGGRGAAAAGLAPGLGRPGRPRPLASVLRRSRRHSRGSGGGSASACRTWRRSHAATLGGTPGPPSLNQYWMAARWVPSLRA
ncbi:MAG TPA: CoA transferase, partial [Crenalkalicoccus sp.]|nr:CoA transferase [Crenalkalicoccus sp.]